MLTRLSALVEVTCAKEEGNYVRFIYFVCLSLPVNPAQVQREREREIPPPIHSRLQQWVVVCSWVQQLLCHS